MASRYLVVARTGEALHKEFQRDLIGKGGRGDADETPLERFGEDPDKGGIGRSETPAEILLRAVISLAGWVTRWCT